MKLFIIIMLNCTITKIIKEFLSCWEIQIFQNSFVLLNFFSYILNFLHKKEGVILNFMCVKGG